ncbi:MAG: hypothetical protein JO262_14660 [Solirubrobacterales bacterium]|nr:hypothetical protein [Solirubrobacterales bacterium]
MRVQLHPHRSTVLLAGGVDGLVVVQRPRVRDRLVARLRRRPLDRALAGGTPPEASAALALRAQRLTEPDQRSSMAGSLRRVMREAQEGPRPTLGRIMPSRARVKAAREELTRLAETLEDPGPVAAGGAAQAWILLTDGTGPLYNPASRITLRAGAARALRELRPWPS